MQITSKFAPIDLDQSHASYCFSVRIPHQNVCVPYKSFLSHNVPTELESALEFPSGTLCLSNVFRYLADCSKIYCKMSTKCMCMKIHVTNSTSFSKW